MTTADLIKRTEQHEYLLYIDCEINAVKSKCIHYSNISVFEYTFIDG